MPVYTFLEKLALEGKHIIPFATHEGSGVGRSEADLKALLSGCEVERAFGLFGHEVDKSKVKVVAWLHSLGFIKA